MVQMHYWTHVLDPRMASDFSELLLRLYRVAQEAPLERFQDAALELLRPLLPFDSSMWGTATTGAQGIDIHTIHLHRSTPDMLVDYAQVKHMDAAAAAVLDRPMVVRSFHTEAWAHGLPEMRDFLRRYGHENIFIAASNQPQHQFVHWISLFRADADAQARAEDIALLRDLAPHLMQALSVNRVSHLQRATAAERRLSPHGAALADARGVLYHHDDLFGALAAAEWSRWNGRSLPPALMDAMQTAPRRWLGHASVVQGRVEHGLLFLRARQRCKADGLAARECLVAQHVAAGQTYKQIAQQLGRSPATVRNQISRIYGKLEVGHVAGLIEALRQADLEPSQAPR
jgi:DNA-binding NarL/FixJ family response regulator